VPIATAIARPALSDAAGSAGSESAAIMAAPA
jgi:hypothetical protein